jgi:hypothetical protein
MQVSINTYYTHSAAIRIVVNGRTGSHRVFIHESTFANSSIWFYAYAPDDPTLLEKGL